MGEGKLLSKDLKNLAFSQPKFGPHSGFLASIFELFSPHPTEVIFKLQFYPKTIFQKMSWKVLHFLFSWGTVPQPHPLGLGIYFGICKSHMFFFDEVIRVFCFPALDHIFLRKVGLSHLPGTEMWVLFAVIFRNGITTD